MKDKLRNSGTVTSEKRRGTDFIEVVVLIMIFLLDFLGLFYTANESKISKALIYLEFLPFLNSNSKFRKKSFLFEDTHSQKRCVSFSNLRII